MYIPNQASSSQRAMRDAIQNIAVGPDRGRDISYDEARLVMQGILNDEIDEVQVAVFLIALRMKRESLDEFLGLFAAMQSAASSAVADVDDLFCLADPFDGYRRHLTMTPFIPVVLAACGYPSLIHGVESVGPKHGITAHKVLKLAGLDVSLSPTQAASRVAEYGWCYLDQPNYAPKLSQLNGLRDRIVKRTAVTTLERLLMPLTGKQRTHLVLGYVHKAYPSIYATVAFAAGYNSTLLLKGVEGGLAPALNKPLRRFFFDECLPEHIDQQKEVIDSDTLFTDRQAAEPLLNKDANEAECTAKCLEVGLAVLNGQASLARNSLILATANVIYAHRGTESLAEAVQSVQYCLDNGSAKAHFDAAISA